MIDFATLRRQLVDNQIRTSAVTDHALIQAFLAVPRERFVDPAEKPFAYSDRELRMSPAAPERRMNDAVQQARMIQALKPALGARAMVVGAGSGYSAAILSYLAVEVVAVETNEQLASAAPELLRVLGRTNVAVVQGKLTEGHGERAPFDAILIDGAVEWLPEALTAQLAPGGLLAVIQRDARISRAVLYERVGDSAARWPRFEAWAALLPGFERARDFVF